MTTPVWPASLPQRPLAEKWSWSPQSNKISFKPELGPSIDRRRGSSTLRIYQGTWDFTSADMVAVFETWFETDLYEGLLQFQMVDPLDGAIYNWKFSADDQPYQIVSHRGTYHEMTCKLVRL